MPTITSYGTSVFSGSWTNSANAVGAPDAVLTSNSTSGSNIQIRVAGFAAIPDNAKLNRVIIGLRFSGSTTAAGLNVNLLSAAGVVDPKVVAGSVGTQLVGVMHDDEIERPGSLFTVAAIKNADFRMQLVKASTGTTSLDAVWVRVVYDEPEYTAYATANWGGTWTNPNNIAGPSDGSSINTATSGEQQAYATYGFPDLPADSVITSVVVGMQARGAAAGSSVSLQLSSTIGTVDPAVNTFTATDVNWVRAEYSLDVSKFTMSALTNTQLTFTLTKGTDGLSMVVSGIWIRVTVSPPSGSAVTGYATSVVNVGSIVNPNNALGSPDDVSATLTSLTTANKSLTGVFNLAALPDNAIIQAVVFGARINSGTVTSGGTQIFTLRGDNTQVDATLAFNQFGFTSAAPSKLVNYEFPSLGSWTVTQVRAIQVRWQFNSGGATNKTNSLDAMWVRVRYTLPATARSKRWNGSAWVDAPIKRWDGSQWVTTTVKRWDGSGWV